MVVVMMIVAMVVVVRMVMMAMVVRMVRVLFSAQQTQESAAFDPQQAQADQHDQRIADNLDDANGVAHRFRRRAEECRGNADDGNAVNACSIADAKESTIPRRQVSSFATR